MGTTDESIKQQPTTTDNSKGQMIHQDNSIKKQNDRPNTTQEKARATKEIEQLTKMIKQQNTDTANSKQKITKQQNFNTAIPKKKRVDETTEIQKKKRVDETTDESIKQQPTTIDNSIGQMIHQDNSI